LIGHGAVEGKCLLLSPSCASATSQIQAAKNLMNAVVLTVKASYVASTMYRKTDEQTKLAPLVV
jgi:amino acid permease